LYSVGDVVLRISGGTKYTRPSEEATSENCTFLPVFIALARSAYVKTRIWLSARLIVIKDK
jgi:hypothetical protein